MKGRKCFPCKACCEGWLIAEINGVKMMPGLPCAHVTKKGCGIYPNRPQNPCVSFKCGWLQDKYGLPAHMKPSECGAIVIFDRDWRNQKVIRVIPTGDAIPDKTIEWLMTFARSQSKPLLLTNHVFEEGQYVGAKKSGYGPPSFTSALKNETGPEDVLML